MMLLIVLKLDLCFADADGADKQSQAHIELDCGERSNLSGVPQCQPSVHEGHEGKSHDDNFSNVDDTIEIIIFTLRLKCYEST